MTAAEVVIEITRQQHHHLVHIGIEEHPQPRQQQELGRQYELVFAIHHRRQHRRNLQVLWLIIIRRHENVDAPLQRPIRLLMMEVVIAARKNDIP